MFLFFCTHVYKGLGKPALNMILRNREELMEQDGVFACVSETANENTDSRFRHEFTGSVDTGNQPMSCEDTVGTLRSACDGGKVCSRPDCMS